MKKSLSYPYIIWSVIFIVIPLALVLVYGITKMENNHLVLTIENFTKFFDPLYFNVLKKSFWLAIVSTIICLFLGYPFAYILSTLTYEKRNILYMLIIVPLWMNFLLRTYAWINILGKNGLINKFLGIFGIEPIKILFTDGAVVLGMVYNFLPFMILPIYTVLCKMDKSLIEAARDLGAHEVKVFTKIIIPLSVPGIISGITMVFMPAVSTFVISKLLGGGQYMLIGNLIEQQFLSVGNWHFGSSISLILMIMILISMAIMKRFDKEEGGSKIW
ncbi:ABC transporter permease [Oceanirhabdus sp. W0125-5]|uniref:ABC transporter permease n=1 Tax=Oceanirhabdus sp. W0125-5 TaxID=2999116 RepID=UPI0022F2E7D7|nr:ABC transporter permease [Oceanirhabdus sp. W0125-5]WBW99328.1 ABC transporter permease [Oceanirhabdus sp. W0125-5]